LDEQIDQCNDALDVNVNKQTDLRVEGRNVAVAELEQGLTASKDQDIEELRESIAEENNYHFYY